MFDLHKKEKKYLTTVVGVVAIIIVGLLLVNRFGGIGVEEVMTVQITEEIKTLPDGTKYLVHPNNLLSGGPPKGGIGFDRGIPALDNPKFISAGEADWLGENDLVFGVFQDSVAKAYPKQILVWHEIVNDKISDMPIAVTYCPLCGTGISFERTVNGEVLRFGTSGKLYNSNLVMYDDKTESYWTQVGGKAVVGPLTGNKLKQVVTDTMLWKDWRELHPDTLVLSKDTGMSRPYGSEPYDGYYSSREVGFGAKFTDTRLHPKTMVSGVVIGNVSKAYPVLEVERAGNVVNDGIGDVKLLVVRNPEIGTSINGFEINPLRVYDREVDDFVLEFKLQDGKLFDNQNSEWNFNGEGISGVFKGKKLKVVDGTSAMWFSWLSFNPDTELFLA